MNQRNFSGAGAGADTGEGAGDLDVVGQAQGAGGLDVVGQAQGAGLDCVWATGDQLDHERLEVYVIAREFLILATRLQARKLPRELRDQFDRSSLSIMCNIGEGAGKTARGDKQRYYEIARGSTTEAATQLDALLIRGAIDHEEYRQARAHLVRIAKMLSRLCRPPRLT